MLKDSISRADYPRIKLTGYWHAHNTRTDARTHTHMFMLTIRVIQKIAEKHLRFQQKEDENSNRRVKQEMENKLC